jgi:hypothetical protein
MPSPEEVDFDDAQVFAVVLVPLGHAAIGHRGVLERDDGREFAGAEDHAAAMLAEMPGQPVDLLVEPHEVRCTRMIGGDPGLTHLVGQFERVRIVPVGEERGRSGR